MIEYSMQQPDTKPSNSAAEAIDDSQFHQLGAHLLQSIELLANGSRLLADTAIAGFTVRGERLREALDRNPILVTALNPVIGYEKAAAIAKQAYREGRPVLDVAREATGLPEKTLRALLDPAALSKGGIHGKPGGGAG